MSIKSFLNKKFGYRWSLYVVKDEKDLHYAMHEDSVVRMLGYVMGYFENGNNPINPWNLYLNFNKTHDSFKLESHHFNGDKLSKSLIDKISSIDPKYRVKGDRPIFVNVKTNEQLKIRRETDYSNLKALIENYDKREEEVTFFSVMDNIFGK